MPGMLHMAITACLNEHMSDVEGNGMLSCGCGIDDEDSPKDYWDCLPKTSKTR